jgi:hypothetical protein
MNEKAQSMTPLAGLKSALTPLLGSFKSPYGIAVLASVGVHGVLFAFGPSMTQSSMASLTGKEGEESERTVPLVQLSPTEQNRLPDFSTPQLPFNLGREESTLTDPPPLPSLSVTPGRRPVTPRLPSPSTSLNPGGQLPGNSAFRTPFFTSPNIPTFRIPAPSRPAIVLPPRSNPEETSPSATPNRPDSTGENSAITGEQARALAVEAEDAARQATQNNVDTSSSTPNMATALEGAHNATAEGSTATPAPNGSDTETMAVAPSPGPQTEVAKLLQGLVFEVSGTTAEEATEALTTWLAEAQTAVGETELLTAETTLSMDSQIRVCVENPPLDGIIGILVASDGQPLGDPQLLKSTGYATLNQAATNAVSSAAFETADSPTAYTFKIDVSYDADNCVQANQLIQPSTAQE